MILRVKYASVLYEEIRFRHGDSGFATIWMYLMTLKTLKIIKMVNFILYISPLYVLEEINVLYMIHTTYT